MNLTPPGNPIPPVPTIEADDELLVAYLDGEVDAALRVTVERRLAKDADFRARLVGLQQSWDLLDELPRSEINPDLVASTLTMAVQEAVSDSTTVKHLRSTSLRRRGAYLGACLGLLLLGYAALAIPLRIRESRMLADVPVIHDLDLYRYAESVEFVRQLTQQKVLVTSQATPDNIEGSLSQRLRTASSSREVRKCLENVTPDVRSQLARGREQFVKLDPREQQRYRAMHDAFVEADDSQQLYKTLVAYEQFLSELTPLRRAGLIKVPPAKRLAEIQELQTELVRGRDNGHIRPRGSDFAALLRWTGNYVKIHEKELLPLLSPEQKRRFEQNNVGVGLRLYAVADSIASSSPPTDPSSVIHLPEPTSDERARLLESLSPGAQQAVRKKLEASGQKMEPVIREWMTMFANTPFLRSGGSRMGERGRRRGDTNRPEGPGGPPEFGPPPDRDRGPRPGPPRF